jgi:toxin CcdB
MAQFDVYRLEGGPLVIDCQADLLDYLHSRFVLPLLPSDLVDAGAGLNPRFDVNGETVHLFPQGAATVSASDLRSHVSSLAEHRFTILNAIDLLLSGV